MILSRLCIPIVLVAILCAATTGLRPLHFAYRSISPPALDSTNNKRVFITVSYNNDFLHERHVHDPWSSWLPTLKRRHLLNPNVGFRGELHAGLRFRSGAVREVVEALKSKLKHGLTKAVEAKHPCHEAMLRYACADK